MGSVTRAVEMYEGKREGWRGRREKEEKEEGKSVWRGEDEEGFTGNHAAYYPLQLESIYKERYW